MHLRARRMATSAHSIETISLDLSASNREYKIYDFPMSFFPIEEFMSENFIRTRYYLARTRRVRIKIRMPL